MVFFPNCKINLGLNITEKRVDGYHNIETVFYPVYLNDVLEVVTLNQSNSNESLPIDFSSSGISIPGDTANNLSLKAFQLLKKDFPNIPPIQMHLHKIIPMGAGLGGGSSDGAFTLKLLNEKYQLNLSQKQLIDYAAELGSDCPFFIINQPCYATGRGEILTPISLDLSAYKFVLVHPSIHINTKWAFEQLTLSKPSISINKIIDQPIETWKELLVNDFEAPFTKQYPIIGEVKNTLYQNGAIYASMSGSGSTVFGIFSPNQTSELKTKFNLPIHIV
jgi:4-diphosphocytidyl-2-C-methyl-D-erythritol kinase